MIMPDSFSVPAISDKITEAFHTGDFSEVEKIEHNIEKNFMELSRYIRSGKLTCLWYYTSSSKKGLVTWTKSLKKKDAIQITHFNIDDGIIYANSDKPIENYQELVYAIQYGVDVNLIWLKEGK